MNEASPSSSCRGPGCSDDNYYYPSSYDDGMDDLAAQAPAFAAGGLVTAVNMVMPMIFTASAPASGSAPPNFAGPAPGAPGGGIPPTLIANPTVIAGTGIFLGLGLVGVGPLVALFDIPRTNDNFAANAGIFEELNDGQRRGKREIRKQKYHLAKFQSWINQTIERGLSNIFRYIQIHVLYLLSRPCLETKF